MVLGVEKIKFLEEERPEIEAERECLKKTYGEDIQIFLTDMSNGYWTPEGFPNWNKPEVSNNIQHEFKPGKYRVSVTCIDDNTPFVIDTLFAVGDKANPEPWKNLTRIYSFGNMKWKSLEAAFANAKNLTRIPNQPIKYPEAFEDIIISIPCNLNRKMDFGVWTESDWKDLTLDNFIKYSTTKNDFQPLSVDDSSLLFKGLWDIEQQNRFSSSVEIVDIPNISSLAWDTDPLSACVSSAWAKVETVSSKLLQSEDMRSIPHILNANPYYFDCSCNLSGDTCNTNYYYNSTDPTWIYDNDYILLQRPDTVCCEADPETFLNHYFNNKNSIFGNIYTVTLPAHWNRQMYSEINNFADCFQYAENLQGIPAKFKLPKETKSISGMFNEAFKVPGAKWNHFLSKDLPSGETINITKLCFNCSGLVGIISGDYFWDNPNDIFWEHIPFNQLNSTLSAFCNCINLGNYYEIPHTWRGWD